MKVLHIITGLENGGAEGAMYRLICNDSSNEHVVISLTDGGKYKHLLEKNGNTVFCLYLRKSLIAIYSFYQLIRLIRNFKPEVVQTWMYHADLIGGLASKFAGIKRVYWGVRHSNFDSNKSSLATLTVVKLCAFFSNFIPNRIVCCASNAVEYHLKLGYPKNKFFIIPNGYSYIDDNVISTDSVAFSIKELAKNKPAIGFVARFNYQKDHLNLVKALELVSKNGYDFNCFFIGDEMSSSNTLLMSMINESLIPDKFSLLGPQNNIHQIMASLDLHVLSSSCGEAFPNVVAESMLYETPCIVTDVGDAALIVGDVGWVCPPSNSSQLADKIMLALEELTNSSELWRKRCKSSQDRILEQFSLENMSVRFNHVWKL